MPVGRTDGRINRMSSEKSSASRHNLFFAQKSFPISNKATELDTLISTGKFP